MSVSSIKLSVACFLLLGVALIFVSEGAEATWDQMEDMPGGLTPQFIYYDSDRENEYGAESEFAFYLAQLIVRTQQGSDFDGLFYLYRFVAQLLIRVIAYNGLD